MILKNSIITLFFSLSSVLFAQKTVTGNVSAAQDGPLPGASIIVKGSDNTGAITDFDGNFSTRKRNGILAQNQQHILLQSLDR